MIGLIPQNLLDDILSRVDIVEIISAYLPLKRSGRNFKANCPFHQEKTPSFMVSPERQIYHCFGCGESGNAFKFLMRHERMEFPEAVEFLAKKTGVVLPESSKEDTKTVSIGTQLYKVNELTALFYENNLQAAEGLKARDYLSKREVSPETARTFKIGLAADKWDGLINYLRGKGVPISVIEKAGLILSKDSGGFYDRFRNRLIFPIFDIRNRVLGFGARVLDNTLPKYINSPETPVYTKGNHLYGLNLSKDAIREKDFAVIVEGYLDFIMPFQNGFKNIVASCGTALTEEQAKLLKRYTRNVVMVYDADAAGQLAALRSLDIFIEEEMDVKVVSLPHGFDPDSFVRKSGIASFIDLVNKAESLFDYKLGVLKTRYNYKEIEGKAKISAGMLETIAKFKNAILKAEYLKKLAQDLNVGEDALFQEIKKVKEVKSYAASEKPLPMKKLIISPTEKLLIKMMLEEKDLIQHIKDSVEPADFQDERASRIASIMFDLLEQGKHIEPSLLINHLPEDDISQFVCESMFSSLDLAQQDKEKVVDDCIQRMKSERLNLKKHQLHEEIRLAQHAGDQERLDKLMQEFDYLVKKR